MDISVHVRNENEGSVGFSGKDINVLPQHCFEQNIKHLKTYSDT